MSLLDPVQAALDAAKQTLAAEEAAATAQHTADQATIADLRHQIDILTPKPPTPAPTPTPVPPAPQPAGTVFGVDVSVLGETKPYAQLAAEHRAAVGSLAHTRVFSSGTPVTALPAGLQAADHPVYSFKSWDPAAFGKWMDSLTAESWVCHFHEPEDDAKRSGNIAGFIASWQQVYKAMDAARKAHPNGHLVKTVAIFMWYQEVLAKAAGCTMGDFLHGATGIDAIGLDCYSPTWGAWATRYATAAELFDPAIAQAKASGLPWCVPELGAVKQAWDSDGAGRAAAITSWAAYAKAHGALWANWWCSHGNVGTGEDYHLENDPKALAAWKAATA